MSNENLYKKSKDDVDELSSRILFNKILELIRDKESELLLQFTEEQLNTDNDLVTAVAYITGAVSLQIYDICLNGMGDSFEVSWEREENIDFDSMEVNLAEFNYKSDESYSVSISMSDLSEFVISWSHGNDSLYMKIALV